MSVRVIFLALVVSVGFTVYSNSLTGEFLWDDELLIVDNKQIKDLHNLPTLFTQHIAHSSTQESNLYRPLQILTYTLNYATSKLDVRAYHLTNISLHILAALMLYWLAQLISQNEVTSLVAALLFISHPIHTEAVTYISGRADPLVALFILFCIIFFIKYSDNENRISFYFLSIFSYLLALLSKEVALIVPLLLFAYDYIYKGQKKLLFKRHLPFFLLGLAYIALRKTVLGFPVQQTVISQVMLVERTPVIFQSLAMYFQKLLLPLKLHMEYEPLIPPITDIYVISGIVSASLLILFAILCRTKQKLVSFSLVCFLISYLPVSNIYPLNAFFAEHWIYVPSLGLFILAAWMVVKISEKGIVFKRLTYLLLILLLGSNFSLTMKQNQYWANPEDFYQRTLKYAPNSFRVYFRLGLLYLRKGMLNQGIENTKKVLALNPNYIPAYENLILGYLWQGAHDKAIAIGEKALQVNPYSDILHNNLGLAYAAKGRDEKALTEFKKALVINSSNAQAYNNLGSAYANMGKNKEAISAFKKALEINPDYAAAYDNLAKCKRILRK